MKSWKICDQGWVAVKILLQVYLEIFSQIIDLLGVTADQIFPIDVSVTPVLNPFHFPKPDWFSVKGFV